MQWALKEAPIVSGPSEGGEQLWVGILCLPLLGLSRVTSFAKILGVVAPVPLPPVPWFLRPLVLGNRVMIVA